MEFLSLRQVEGTPVVEYQAKILMLERFALGSFLSVPSLYPDSILVCEQLWPLFHVTP